jgi:hypothetical protein
MSIMTEPECGVYDNLYVNVNDAIACYHYLRNLGTRQCSVPNTQRDIVMCVAGDAKVEGRGIGASSYWYVDNYLPHRKQKI